MQRYKKKLYLCKKYCSMLILGIDPGTQILGYSLLDTDGSKPQLVVMDVLYLRKIADFHLRIRKIFDTTQRIIDSFHPDHLAIEAPFAGKNVQSMLKLGKAQGVAIGAAISRDLSYTEYEPSAVKQRVTGSGNAAKEQVAAMLQSIFGFNNLPSISMLPMPSPWPTPATLNSPTPWATSVVNSSTPPATNRASSNGPISLCKILNL